MRLSDITENTSPVDARSESSRVPVRETGSKPWWDVIAALDTGRYVAEIMRTGVFCEGGAEESLYDAMIEAGGLHDPEDADEDAVRAFLTRWVPLRLNYVGRALDRGVSGDPIYARRAVMLSGDVTSVIKPDTRLGIFWSTGKPSPWGFHGDSNGHDEYMIDAEIPWASVDWPNTVKSRADYANGDDEEEIRVIPGQPVSLIKMTLPNGSPAGVQPGRYRA